MASRIRPAVALALAALLTLTACRSDDPPPSDDGETPVETPTDGETGGTGTGTGSGVGTVVEGGGETIAGAGGTVAGLTVSEVRSRMSPMVVGVAAVYLDIENTNTEADALVGATVAAEIAGFVELHESYEADEDEADDGMDGGDDHGGGMADDGMDGDGDGAPMMRMRQVERIELPAGTTVSLEPGGLHIMLLDLVADLSAGDEFELTLEFEKAGTMTVIALVREQV